MQAVDRRLGADQHARKISLRNENDVVPSRQPALDLAEPVIKGRQGKLQHHDGVVSPADLLQQSFEARLES